MTFFLNRSLFMIFIFITISHVNLSSQLKQSSFWFYVPPMQVRSAAFQSWSARVGLEARFISSRQSLFFPYVLIKEGVGDFPPQAISGRGSPSTLSFCDNGSSSRAPSQCKGTSGVSACQLKNLALQVTHLFLLNPVGWTSVLCSHQVQGSVVLGCTVTLA